MLFSIVTVCYNAKDLLERTINSITSQDFNDYEYIIIDGGSTDGSSRIIEKHEDKINYYISEKDSGIYDAMNKAVIQCNGKWVLFLNAGDTFTNNAILDTLSKHTDSDDDFYYGHRYRVNEEGDKTLEKAGDLSDAYNKEVVFHQALMTRTELLRLRPYDESYKLAADYEFMIFSLSEGKSFVNTEITICNFLEGGSSRQNYLLAQIEAIKASLNHNTTATRVKQNFYLENLVIQNMGYYINKAIQTEKAKNPELKLYLQKKGRGVQINTNAHNPVLDDVINRLNAPLKAENISTSIQHRLTPISLAKRAIRKSRDIFSSANKTQANNDRGQDTTKIKSKKNATNQQLQERMKITIATVCYNADKNLERTIESVTAQAYKNIEYIIIDGASNDTTCLVLEKHRPKLDIVVSETDQGIYDAMNKAINLASGDYIIFMNAGDEFACNEVIKNIFDSEKDVFSDLIYGDRFYKKNDGEIIYQEARGLETVFYRMPYCHQSLFLKTEIIRDFPFNTTYKFSADYEQSVKLYLAGCSYNHLETPICIFEEGGASESGIRPYLEVLKILFDNCKDETQINNNAYLSAFRRNAAKLLKA